MSVRAAILVGGRGLRMGGAVKALLPFEGRRILDRQLEVLESRFSEIVLCTSRPDEFAGVALPTCPDPEGALGPIAGVVSALEWARGDDVFVVAGDMPQLSVAAVDLVLACAAENPDVDAVACRAAGIVQPLHAIYRHRSLALWTNRLRRGERSLHRALSSPDVAVAWVDERELRQIDPGLSFLCNVNQPAELR